MSKGSLDRKTLGIIWKWNKDYDYFDDLEKFDFSRYMQVFKDEELLSDILLMFADKNIDFSTHMNYITDIFKAICITKNDKTIEVFKGLVDVYINNQNLFLDKSTFDKVVTAFDDKEKVLELYRSFSYSDSIKNTDNPENISVLLNYAIRARKYYVDDRECLASAISLLDDVDYTLIKYGEKEKIEEIVEEKLNEDRKANGQYNVDRKTLADIEEKTTELYNSKSSLNTLLDMVDKQIEILRLELKRNKDELTSAKIKELESIKNEGTKITKEFNATYLELLNSYRESITNEKDLMMADFSSEITKIKAEFESFSHSIGKRVNTEINRVNNITTESEKRLRDFVDNNDKIGKMIQTAVANEELLNQITNITTTQVANPKEIITPTNTTTTNSGLTVPTASQIIIPDPTLNPDIIEKPANKTIYYFDRTVPFKERFKRLMELKDKDIYENNAIYHEKFDDILKLILEGQSPYMYGPSGCGKTFMIDHQIAKLLGLNVVTNGYVLYEQDIIGYTNSATGNYVPSNFYRAYKFGNLIFFDELDNGIANATVVLNRFLGENNKEYIFPDGKLINKHPNFRIIAAGNTKGNGRTEAYNTRSKLDESVLQRLVTVEVGYDNRIEKEILKDYPKWYEFATSFRSAIEHIRTSSGEDVNTIGTFTTRDAESIKRYKDDDCFTDEQIMEYEIIENKDIDYLSQIENNLEENHYNDLFRIFHNVIEEKKRKIKR